MNEHKQKAVEALRGLKRGDWEAAHIKADEILLDYLRATYSTEVAEAYEKARKRIGFWYA